MFSLLPSYPKQDLASQRLVSTIGHYCTGKQSHVNKPSLLHSFGRLIRKAKSFCVAKASSSPPPAPPRSFYSSLKSLSAEARPREYGVFLNFRGKNTRDGFVKFLNRDLTNRGIHTYLDSEDLEKGADISTIMAAIPNSTVAIVVFSKDYASSPWCLDELVNIMKCRQTTGLQVLPVFYHVNPEDVESQTGSFKKAFDQHQKSYNKETIAEWRIALKNAASVAGWDYASKDISDESTLSTTIVEDVLGKLRRVYSTNDFDGLVGMHSRVEKLESLLRIGGEENDSLTRIVGICGMGGSGKSTLARAVFDKYASHFEASRFIGSICQESEHVGLERLRDELFASLLNNKANRSIYTSPSTSSLDFVKNQLRNTKVLIVLDGVDKYEQIETLAGKNEWFGVGSRIIITSRDRQVLKNRVGIDSIHDIELLNDHEARQLFNLFAFKEIYPLADRLELSQRAVRYVQGHPYALKVLGLFLYGKSEEVWKSALNELQTTSFNLLQAVHKTLRISYDGLVHDDQEVFLHITCFFRGEPKTRVEKILDACDFSTTVCLSRLADKSLIDITSDSIIDMHDLSQELGQEIVRQQGEKEPGIYTRLWRPEDICHVLANNTGTPAVEGIFLDMSSTDRVCLLDKTVFSKMAEIKLLEFYHPEIVSSVVYPRWFRRRYREELGFLSNRSAHLRLSCPQGLDSLPNQLRHLVWHFYPLKALPPKFCFEKLVELDMSCSNIERLWTGTQDLPNLRVVRVRHCKHLIEMPDFSRAPNVEIIDFEYCERLCRISPSILRLKNLRELNLSCCSGIENFPSTKGLPSLKKLFLSNCKGLNMLSELSENIEELYLDGTAIKEVHFSQLTSLRKLDLSCCRDLWTFPEIPRSLEELSMSETPAASFFIYPDFFGGLSWIHNLDLSKGFVFSIDPSIKQLSHLESLHVSSRPCLTSLPEVPPHLINLNASDCSLMKVSNSSFELTESYEKSLEISVSFDFGNCRYLSEDAQKNTSDHLLHTIETHSQLPKNVDRRYEVKFIYAGSGIPDWIQHQSPDPKYGNLDFMDCQNPGPLITIDLPPDWRDTNKFLGFVLCVVYKGHGFPESLFCECHFRSKNGRRNAKFDVQVWRRWPKGEHMSLLWYSSGLVLHQAIIGNVEGDDYNEVSFRFHV